MGLADVLGAAAVEAAKEPSFLFSNRNVEGLVTLLGHPQRRFDAAKYLVILGDDTIETLLRYLGHEESGQRLVGATALAEIETIRRIDSIAKQLEDSNVQWQEEVVRAVEPLIRVLTGDSRDAKRRAADALGYIGDVRAVEPLIQALEDRAVRMSAIVALGNVGNVQAVAPLIRALEDRASDTRVQAALALGRTGDQRAVEPLIQALEDRHGDIRRAAASALAMLGDPAVEPLVRTLKHDEWPVRERAAWALGKAGNVAALHMLRQALDDEDDDVRLTAQRSLRKIADANPGTEPVEDEGASAVVCWYCKNRVAQPSASIELEMTRLPEEVIVKVPRCPDCEAVHGKTTKINKVVGAFIVALSIGGGVLASYINYQSTGSSSIWPCVCAGGTVFTVAMFVAVCWQAFVAPGYGGTRSRKAYLIDFPKLKEMQEQGWELEENQPES